MQVSKSKISLGIVIIFLIWSCKTITFHPDQYAQDYLMIGDGGGYTGLETSFYFTKNGDVFRHSGRDTIYEKLPSIDRHIVSQAIQSIQQLDLMQYQYENPGNVYKFLAFKIEGKDNRVVWGGNQDEVNPAITSIYRLLNQSLQNDK